MILSRFLKPKWQHADPDTRKQAIRELDQNEPTLIELARRDPEPAVRCAALERISEIGLLDEIAKIDTDAGVRTAARERQQRLLAGKAPDSPPLTNRLERLRHSPDMELVEFLLQHAVEPELRRVALEQVHSEATLAEIAAQNPHPEVRLAALERVYDANLLSQIARLSRNRDKRLYRQARDRLDALVTVQAQADHLERLCTEMENLPWDGESGPNAGRFPKLEQEWREQEPQAPHDLRERYVQARTRFLADRQASAGRRSQRLEMVTSLDLLLQQLQQQSETSTELTATIQHTLHEKPLAWSQLGPVQDAESRRLELRFQQLQQDIHEQERILHRNHVRAQHLREVLRQAEALLEQPSEVRDSDLKHLRQRWEGLERPESPTLAYDLQRHIDGVFDKLRARLQRQVQQRDQEWQELQEWVQQLETVLDAGELQQAMQIQEQARQRLKHNIGLTRTQMASIEERLQHCAGRIGELQDWRRWGTRQAREQLCVTAENLVGLEADPIEIAQRIQQTREAWKRLDHHEGAAPKVLWKRFNDACERAYAPCQAHFEAQNRERRENFDKKQALCEQLEQFEATTDWQQVDWREADRLRRRAQEHWYKIGPVNRADRKNLDRRFQEITRCLDTRLGAEREREVQRRQQLIQRIQSMAENTDLRAAIEAAKLAQAEWHPTVQTSPRQEQALWKDFRAACDAVFARRQQEQQAADTERQTHLARKLALCAEIEALSTIDSTTLAQAQARLQAIQQEWESIGPIPKTEQRTLSQRFETAIRQFSRHEQVLRQTSTRETFHALYERSQVCANLEALLTTMPVDMAVFSQARKTWQALPVLPATLLDPVQQRFDMVIQALVGPPEQGKNLLARLKQNLGRKRIWCVCMEIVAGVESPPEFAQLRMEYQVARLSASLAGAAAKTDSLYDPKLLQEQWCFTGALPLDAAAELDTRFLHALRMWWQREDA